jgi:quinoprotein glucose dehydrogenase
MIRRTTLRTAGCGIAVMVGVLAAKVPAQSSKVVWTEDGQWRSYHGNLRGHHYSPLDQISASNFSTLELAWRFKTDGLGTHPEYKLEGTPLMVGGVLYTVGGTRRDAIALDAASGELLWVHGEHEGKRAMVAPRQLSGRGVGYWADGNDQRVFYITTGFRLVALDAKTGSRIASFGKDGIIDLKEAAVFGSRQPIDLETGEIGVHNTPVVTSSGVVLVGSSMKEGATPVTHNNVKGLVQAFDAKTGKRLWNFNTIPRPGEYGNDTWLGDSWAENGNTGVWNQISVDEDLGLAYLPVETPTGDHYGGHRPGNNLFADTIVAVDLKTGQRKWHYQLVHHSLWNFDIPAAPILADIVVGGRPIKAVAVMTKAAFLYVFDRVTGQPVWPIEERPVPKGDVPGEWYSPTQPFPTKPPAFDRQGLADFQTQQLKVDELIDFTPELRQEALKIVSWYKPGHIFTPPIVSRREGPLATLREWGGINWPGGAYDPETHVLYTSSEVRTNTATGLITPAPGTSDMRYVTGNAIEGYRYVPTLGEGTAGDNVARTAGAPGRNPAAAASVPPGVLTLTVQGLPLIKPPYGKINAVNLDKGEILWQVPHGETPDNIRNHPALKGLNIPRTGQPGTVGVLVTKNLVIAGENQVTTLPTRPRGAMLRAYDKATGQEVGAVYMPAPQSSSPMTYSLNGKQYIVLAISGGNYSGEYVAFSLPSTNQASSGAAR